jgi:hypothetical protein
MAQYRLHIAPCVIWNRGDIYVVEALKCKGFWLIIYYSLWLRRIKSLRLLLQILYCRIVR